VGKEVRLNNFLNKINGTTSMNYQSIDLVHLLQSSIQFVYIFLLAKSAKATNLKVGLNEFTFGKF